MQLTEQFVVNHTYSILNVDSEVPLCDLRCDFINNNQQTVTFKCEFHADSNILILSVQLGKYVIIKRLCQ